MSVEPEDHLHKTRRVIVKSFVFVAEAKAKQDLLFHCYAFVSPRRHLLCMPPKYPPAPPPPPWRSRSPLARKEDSFVAAYHRDVQRQRGGRQAKASTRGIHRRILQCLRERLERVLQVITFASHIQVYQARQGSHRLIGGIEFH